MRNYQGSKVVIIGVGMTGISCVNFFLERGIIPKVIDTSTSVSIAYKIPRVVPYCLGRFCNDWVLNATLIVVSPGVRLDHPILIEALRLGIEMIGDIELFVRETTVPIVAITGSNGKSTVTQLLGNMAKCAGWSVGIAGNIGVPVLTLLNKIYQLYILEISSFQLDITYSLHAVAATVLNVSEDHIDRYPGGLQQYCISKQKIYRNAMVCVINAVDILTIPEYANNHSNFVTFAVDVESANYHLRYYKGTNWIVAYDKYVLDVSEMQINSYVNYMNALSALALSDIVKIPRSASLMALRQFSGLAHRCQLIYKHHDVSWINDSKATNISATKEAIHNVMISASKLHVLLGGDSKQVNFSSLEDLIKQQEIDIYCFGKDGLVLTELGHNNVVLTDTMQEAICIVSRRVKKKDIVLLSPACSSLDQFPSFKIRGFVFTHFARKFG